MALGPVLGGVLVTSAGWRSIFWINIPVGMRRHRPGPALHPESKAPRARRIDPVGQVLVIVLLAPLTYGIIEAPNRGWGSPLILGAFALAVASLVGLLRYEPRRDEPLIDLRFFRSVPFAAATVTAVAAFATLGGFLFINTLYLQEVRGLSALQAGLDTLPMAVMTMVMSPISGRIVGSRGSRLPLVVAGAALDRQLCDAGPASTPRPHSPGSSVRTWSSGLASAWSMPHHQCRGVRHARAQAGVAAGIASTSRQIGQTLGVAVVGAIVTSRIHGSVHG